MEKSKGILPLRTLEIIKQDSVGGLRGLPLSRKSYKVRIRINNKVHSFLHREKSACEDFMKNLIEKSNGPDIILNH